MAHLPGLRDLDAAVVAVPPAVLEILRRLEEAGHETWCVGGALRDALLRIAHQDYDLATAATPDEVRRLFPRSIPVGVEHGTVGVLDPQGVLHEVTTFRRDVQTDGRHATVQFGASLTEDLARRDFTVNAIAYHPVRHEWCDPFDGWNDLQAGIIRAVGDPAQRFREDRLRILRAIRFARRFEFAIDPLTWQAILAQGHDTGHLSAERVRDEWIKMLGTTRRFRGLPELWMESGVAAVWMPELRPFPDALCDRREECASTDPVMLTALCTTASAPVWRRLKGSTAEIRTAEAIDALPPRPADASPVAVRRWMAMVGLHGAMLRHMAPYRGNDSDHWSVVFDDAVSRGDPTSRGQLAVTGHDLIEAGMARPGPSLGRLLDQLLDAVLDAPERNTREALLELARTVR